MIETPRILQTTAQRTAVIGVKVPRHEMQKVMGPALGELMSTLAAQGIEPEGPWFGHHFKMYPDVFDFEIGVPVPGPVKETGRVVNSELPAATVARTILHGGYEGLGGAWPQLDAWIVAQGRAPAESLWETYLIDPSRSPDPAAWRTELTRPLIA